MTNADLIATLCAFPKEIEVIIISDAAHSQRIVGDVAIGTIYSPGIGGHRDVLMIRAGRHCPA